MSFQVWEREKEREREKKKKARKRDRESEILSGFTEINWKRQQQ